MKQTNTTRRDFLKSTIIAGAGAMCASKGFGFLTDEMLEGQPNIVLIYIDDMGLMDIEPYGSTYYETPVINKLAPEGMKFTRAYAASNVCSPSRHALLTGRAPSRTHFTNVMGFPDKGDKKLRTPEQDSNLDAEELTFAEALRSGGYATGFVGKWHMGGPTGTDQGFDYFDELHTEGSNPKPAVVTDDPPFNGDPKEVREIFDKSMRFISGAKKESKPFMLYMAHHTVHVQLQTTQKLFEKYKGKAPGKNGQNNPYYAGMVEDLDTHLGRFLNFLKTEGLEENTAIIFTSDNGGLLWAGGGAVPVHRVTTQAPLKGGKGEWWEGSHRVPLLIKWPGKTKGGTVSDVPTITMDIYPTMLDIAGLPQESAQHRDGISLKEVLLNNTPLPPRSLFFHYPHYKAKNCPNTVVVKGDYKLIVFHEEESSPYGGPVKMLYNIKEDVSETKNLLYAMPEKAAELYKEILEHRASTQAQMPAPNNVWKPGTYANLVPVAEGGTAVSSKGTALLVPVSTAGKLTVNVTDSNSRVWYTFYNGEVTPGKITVPVNPGPHFMEPDKTNDDFLAYGEYTLKISLLPEKGTAVSYSLKYVHRA